MLTGGDALGLGGVGSEKGPRLADLGARRLRRAKRKNSSENKEGVPSVLLRGERGPIAKFLKV